MTSIAATIQNTDQRLARGARTQQKILAAALGILGDHGYGALSISGICTRAGVSPTSLYHHFGDKAGLLSAMIDESLVRNTQRYLSSMAGLVSPLDQLDAFMASVRQVFVDDAQNSSAILSALSQARGEATEIAETIGAARQRVWAFMAGKFAEYFKVEDGLILAHIFSAFSSYIPQVRQDPDSAEDVEALFTTLRTVLLIIGAAIQPDLMKDEKYAAAVEVARRELLQNPAVGNQPRSVIAAKE